MANGMIRSPGRPQRPNKAHHEVLRNITAFFLRLSNIAHKERRCFGTALSAYSAGWFCRGIGTTIGGHTGVVGF